MKKPQKTVKRVLKYIFKCLLKVEHFSIWPSPPTFRFLCGSHAQCLIGFCHNERAQLASAIPFPWASHWPGSFFPLDLLCPWPLIVLDLAACTSPGFCPHKKMSWTFWRLYSRVFYTPLSSLNNQRNHTRLCRLAIVFKPIIFLLKRIRAGSLFCFLRVLS